MAIIPRCVLRVKIRSRIKIEAAARFPRHVVESRVFFFFSLSSFRAFNGKIVPPRIRSPAEKSRARVFTHSSFSFLHGLSAWSTRKLGGRRDHIIRKYMYAVTWLFRRSPQISRQPAENTGDRPTVDLFCTLFDDAFTFVRFRQFSHLSVNFSPRAIFLTSYRSLF